MRTMMKTRIASVALAGAMALSASGATAATYVIPLNGTGTYTATYSPGAATSFTDLFKFSLPGTGVLSVLFKSTQTNNKNNVNFSTNGARFSGPGYLPYVILPRQSTGVLELIMKDLGTGPGSYSLSFKGSSQINGQYTAKFAYYIPEPAIWAMMILGFGVVGGAMRVRTRKTAFAV